jgi:hypothetical protein
MKKLKYIKLFEKYVYENLTMKKGLPYSVTLTFNNKQKFISEILPKNTKHYYPTHSHTYEKSAWSGLQEEGIDVGSQDVKEKQLCYYPLVFCYDEETLNGSLFSLQYPGNENCINLIESKNVSFSNSDFGRLLGESVESEDQPKEEYNYIKWKEDYWTSTKTGLIYKYSGGFFKVGIVPLFFREKGFNTSFPNSSIIKKLTFPKMEPEQIDDFGYFKICGSGVLYGTPGYHQLESLDSK